MPFERWIGVAAGLTAGVAILWYLYMPRMQEAITEQEEGAAAVEAPVAVAPPVGQAPKYPVPEAPVAAPAPAPAAPPANAAAPSAAPSSDLAASDQQVRSDAARVFGAAPVESFLIPERVIQNIVATIDSLDRDPVPLRFRAIANVPELPVVEKNGDAITLSAENGERYRPLTSALQAANAKDIAAVYLRYYPLLQRAYRELGYPGAHFNDRVVAIIDHLLATPDVPGPIELVRPKVLYLYADPALEELSSGRKLLVRIGPANAKLVKGKLAEIRAIITSGQKSAG
jgi:hypothetical protein